MDSIKYFFLSPFLCVLGAFPLGILFSGSLRESQRWLLVETVHWALKLYHSSKSVSWVWLSSLPIKRTRFRDWSSNLIFPFYTLKYCLTFCWLLSGLTWLLTTWEQFLENFMFTSWVSLPGCKVIRIVLNSHSLDFEGRVCGG